MVFLLGVDQLQTYLSNFKILLRTSVINLSTRNLRSTLLLTIGNSSELEWISFENILNIVLETKISFEISSSKYHLRVFCSQTLPSCKSLTDFNGGKRIFVEDFP